MTPFQQRQLVRGAAFFAFGVFFTGYALFTLDIGTPRNMGAGMFPFVVGTVIVLFGLGFAVPTLVEVLAGHTPKGEAGRWETIEWRGIVTVVASLAAFTALVGPFGMIPATLAMTAVAAIGNHKLTPLVVVALAAAFVVTTYVIFVLGLNLPLVMWDWPY